MAFSSTTQKILTSPKKDVRRRKASAATKKHNGSKKRSGLAIDPQPLRAQTKSTPYDIDSLGSFDDSLRSEDIEVIVRKEDFDYDCMVKIGKLSRLISMQNLWDDKLSALFVMFTFVYSYDISMKLYVQIETHGYIFALYYVVAMILVGIPLMSFEFWLGQFTSLGPARLFSQMVPAISGIAVSQLLLNIGFITTSIYSVTMLISTYPATMELTPRWSTCANWFNRHGCTPMVHPCAEMRQLSIYKPTQIGDICVLAALTPEMRLAMKPLDVSDKSVSFLQWLARLSPMQLMYEGMENITQMVQTTLPTPIFYAHLCFVLFGVLVIVWVPRRYVPLLIKTVIILRLTVMCVELLLWFGNASTVLKHWQDLNTIPLFPVLSLVISSLKLGQGGLIFLGSHNKFRNGVLIDSMILVMATVLMSLLGAFLHLIRFDAFLQEMAGGDTKTFLSLKARMRDEPLFRSAAPTYLSSNFVLTFDHKNEQSVAIFFFTFSIVSLVIINTVVRLEMLTSMILEKLNDVPSACESRYHAIIIKMLILYVCLILGLFWKTPLGMKKMVLLENLTLPSVCTMLILVQLISVCYIYGSRRFLANILCMTLDTISNEQGLTVRLIGSVQMIYFAIVAPCMLVYIISMHFDSDDSSELFGEEQSIIMFSILLPFVFMFHQKVWLTKQYKKPFASIFDPNPDLWGPRREVDRELANIVERKFTAIF
ncbi:unnamed protein product [Caenorhabditis auriculariae]|uniref:Uncharacterized protein n=1 Tax=Caenorhabditis auriculariae TaxID=2777116 RepID=A0A8S1HWY7_9PELO|nr:unnamed protein product [Caenorhabditis auriculariae]